MKVVQAAGKRKRAIARATLYSGTGKIRINKTLLENFNPEMYRLKLQEPLILAGDTANKVDVNITVMGGGVNGQVDAARVALCRCLVQHNKKLEKSFLSYDRYLLVSDSRRKEVCKPNDSKARKARQKSYR